MTRARKTALVLVAVVAACAAVIAAIMLRAGDTPAIAGFVYPEPKAIAPFELTEQDGKPFNVDTLKGKWSFVYFGYTYCPDVCPTTLAELGRAQRALEAAGQDKNNQYFFVSVDPQRDTPKRLAQYVPYFDKKFIGVTGDERSLAKFTQEVGVIYSFPEGRKGDNYAVDHSSTLALFDPDARLHAVFTAPHKAEAIVEGFRKILGGR
jgi:protein SCO1/2